MRRAPILVPATAPAGRSRKASSSGQTTPRSNISPERVRKPSSAAPSADESQPPSRRPSAWTTRPSMVGVLAATRMGKNLLRNMRSSNNTSKRGSTCGERAEPPPPNMEPTYRLEPKALFRPAKVEEVIKSTLEEQLKGRTYRPKVATMLCRTVSDDLREKVKKLGYDRYRCVVSVVIGEKKDQGVMTTSRCAWDDKRDSFASYTFQASDFFCTANVYGVYKE